jgi:hypothetical protein
MSDVNLKAEDQDEDAGFESSIDVKNPDSPAAEKKPDVPPVDPEAARLAEEARRRAEDEAPVVVTKKQLAAIMAELEENKSLKKTVQSLTGTVGNQKQEIDSLKTTTAALNITDEDFQDLIKEFPVIGNGVKNGLGSVLKRLVGVKPPPGVGEADIKKAIFEVVNDQQLELLEDEFGVDEKGNPIWKHIIGKRDDPNSAYRVWLAAQAPKYQEKVNKTYSAQVVINAIKRFQSAQGKVEADRKAAEVKSGTDRRRAAVTPRGSGGEMPPAKGEPTEDEAFASASRE